MKKMILSAFILGALVPAMAKVQEVNYYKVSGENYELTPNVVYRDSNESLCWVASMDESDADKKFDITEVFNTPEDGVFAGDAENMKITSSKDGRVWTIARKAVPLEDSRTNSCWIMGQDDPVGDYTLTVTIRKQKQKPFHFVIK